MIDGRSMLIATRKDEPIHNSLYFEVGATRAILKDGKKYLVFKAPESKPIKKMVKKQLIYVIKLVRGSESVR